jgi:hypothetical protein
VQGGSEELLRGDRSGGGFDEGAAIKFCGIGVGGIEGQHGNYLSMILVGGGCGSHASEPRTFQRRTERNVAGLKNRLMK